MDSPINISSTDNQNGECILDKVTDEVSVNASKENDTCEPDDSILPAEETSDIEIIPSNDDPQEISDDDEDDDNDACVVLSSGEEEESDDIMITGITNMQGEEQWRNVHEPIRFINSLMAYNRDPASVLAEVFHVRPSRIPSTTMGQWSLLFQILSEPSPRKKLDSVNTLEDVLHLFDVSNKIIVLSGAGISVSCGIPDFRSRDGIYARLAVDYPDLVNPQAMFDLTYFQSNSKPFFKFAKEIYPGQFKPSIGHRFIKALESRNKLLRNYTQNIDTLEQVAGITKVIQCHGSFATASCMECKRQVKGEEIREEVMNQVVPRCTTCPPETPQGIMKPDIVFFGEALPNTFHSAIAQDKDEVDLLIVIGSSLKVRPVAHIPNTITASVPQILINREVLSSHGFDVELLGDGDVILAEVARRLGYTEVYEESDTAVDTTLRGDPKTCEENIAVETPSLTTDPLPGATGIEPNESSEPAGDKESCEICSNSDDVNPSLDKAKEQDSETLPDKEVTTVADSTNNVVGVSETLTSDKTNETEVGPSGDCENLPSDKTKESEVGPSGDCENLPSDKTKESEVGPSGDCENLPSTSQAASIHKGGKFTEINCMQLMQEITECDNNESKKISTYLPPGKFGFLPPNTYIFPGAEYSLDDSPDDSSHCSTSSEVATTLSDDEEAGSADDVMVMGESQCPIVCDDDDDDDVDGVGNNREAHLQDGVQIEAVTHSGSKRRWSRNSADNLVLEVSSGAEDDLIRSPAKRQKVTLKMVHKGDHRNSHRRVKETPNITISDEDSSHNSPDKEPPTSVADVVSSSDDPGIIEEVVEEAPSTAVVVAPDPATTEEEIFTRDVVKTTTTIVKETTSLLNGETTTLAKEVITTTTNSVRMDLSKSSDAGSSV